MTCFQARNIIVTDSFEGYFVTFGLIDMQAGSRPFRVHHCDNQRISPRPEIRFGQNYPNPFNPVTTVTYDLPEAGRVTIDVFDAHGRVVESLVTGHQSLGKHAVAWDVSDKSSGAYFVRMEAGVFSDVRTMVLIR